MRVGLDRCSGDGWSTLVRPEHQRPSTEASMVAGLRLRVRSYRTRCRHVTVDSEVEATTSQG
jgi:hypothetical protein